MGRQPGCDKAKLKKGPWDKEEDEKLKNCILKNGIKCWPEVAKLSGLQRCAKSCRLRWVNYLNPDIKRGNFSEDEEQTIIRLRSVLGNRWSTIASYLPGRTDNEIKNYWHTHLKKKAHELGIEHPNTHIPIQLAPSNSMVQKDTIPHVNHPNTHIPIQLALSNSKVQKDTIPHVNHPNTHIAIRLSNPVVQKDTIPKCEVIEVISDNEGGKTDGQRNKANTSMTSVTSFILENYQAICDRLDLGMWLCQDNRTKSVDGSS